MFKNIKEILQIYMFIENCLLVDLLNNILFRIIRRKKKDCFIINKICDEIVWMIMVESEDDNRIGHLILLPNAVASS